MNDELRKLFAQHDALVEECKQSDRRPACVTKQHDGDGLVFKTYENPPVQQQSFTTMTPEQQKPWDVWCDRRADDRIDRFVHKHLIDATVEFVCEYTHKHLAKLREEITEQIGQLRADMNVVATAQRGEIKSLKGQVHFRKRSDAA